MPGHANKDDIYKYKTIFNRPLKQTLSHLTDFRVEKNVLACCMSRTGGERSNVFFFFSLV